MTSLILVMVPCSRLTLPGKVVVDSCLTFCKMELALEILCEAGEFWSSQEESLTCIGVIGDPSKTSVDLYVSVELFTCVVSTN